MVSSFPRLIAAAHVLHRLLAPRHSPCALVLLIRKNTFYCRYGVFKVRVSSNAHEKNRRRRWSLKTQQRERPEGRIEVDVVPGESVDLDGPKAIDGRRAEAQRPFNRADAYRSKSSGIP